MIRVRVSDIVISHKYTGCLTSFPLLSELFNVSLGIGKAAMVGVGEGDVHDSVTVLSLIGGLILLSHH